MNYFIFNWPGQPQQTCPNPPSETLYEENVSSSSGAFLSRICAINLGKTQLDSQIYCQNHGMRLYIINSDQTQSELFRITTKYLTNSANSLWIDGTLEDDGNWYISNNLAYSGLDFQVTSNTINDSLSLSSAGIQFHVEGRPRTSTYWFVCELNNT